MFRANALAEDLVALQSKFNDSNPTVKELQNQISDLNHACCIKDSQNQKLEHKIDELIDEIKFYKVKVYRIDQSNKQIFLNKPRDFEDFTKGLGFEDPKNLLTGQLIVPPLYDENMMRYGLLSQFVRPCYNDFDTEEQLSKCEVKINYDHINDSYDLFNLPLCPKNKKHSVIIVELDENSNESSTDIPTVEQSCESKSKKEIIPPKPTPVRPYIPQSVLEDLKQTLNEKQSVIDALQSQNHYNKDVPDIEFQTSSVVYDCSDLNSPVCVVLNPTPCSSVGSTSECIDASVQTNWDHVKTYNAATQTKQDNMNCNDHDEEEKVSVDQSEHVFPNVFNTGPLQFSEETQSYLSEIDSVTKRFELERIQRLSLLTEVNKLKIEVEYKNIVLQPFANNDKEKASKLLQSGPFSKFLKVTRTLDTSIDTTPSSTQSTETSIQVQVYLNEIAALTKALEKEKQSKIAIYDSHQQDKKVFQNKSTIFATKEWRYCKIIKELNGYKPELPNVKATKSFNETSMSLKTNVPSVTKEPNQKNPKSDLDLSNLPDLDNFLEENDT
uniref:uncharacterized protein LOC122584651 n=1 Tax=Erigeron canadensis TaxID=72917 RepID=UPI001CB93B77|nr:uncharacterized protein LOC122584651 [Erigeron canadensis]